MAEGACRETRVKGDVVDQSVVFFWEVGRMATLRGPLFASFWTLLRYKLDPKRFWLQTRSQRDPKLKPTLVKKSCQMSIQRLM